MVTSVVAYHEPNDMVWSAGGWIDGLTGLTWDHGKGQDLHAVMPPRDPDYVAACALMVRRDILAGIGGLDPGYFIYFEDAELGLRAKTHGYGVSVLEKPVVHHAAARRRGLRKDAVAKLFIFARSTLRFVLKNWPLSRMPAALVAWVAFYTAVAASRGPRRYGPSVTRAVIWNLRHLEETKAARSQSRPVQPPTQRFGELCAFLLRMAQHLELFPY